jgi:hypothetical protein
MSYPTYDRPLAEADRRITEISQWVDNSPAYAGVDPEARDWRRIQKVGQEFGEALEAFCGTLGENPRKGFTHRPSDVRRELFDVALSALGAVEHLDGNNGGTLAAFLEHVAYVRDRALGATPNPSV